ncbi:MAG: FecR domain-containing protein [Bacteroidetes bacterium]|nr:FecR domain-containing protein [Bacteroidota bacterium]
MNLQEARQFVARFITGEYAPEEYEAFLKWLRKANNDELNEIADEYESKEDLWDTLAVTPSTEWVSRLEQKLDDSGGGVVRRMNPERIRRRTWIAAASVIAILSAGVYLFVKEGNKAAPKAENQGQVSLAYYTTESNPRGADQKELILADGSKIWLNAASSLKFPSQFDGPDRVVELSGEAFFEVEKNSDKPFRVLIKDAKIEVLGTHFNVKAYDNEPTSRTTLIDGAVRMESGSKKEVLNKPGQRAEIPYSLPGVDAQINVTSGVNFESALAWKNGLLQFENDDLHTVMRAIERAYNVDVQFEPNCSGEKIYR